MRVKPILKGIATRIPVINELASRNSGGEASARYCYSVWLRHLTMAHANGLSTELDTLAELGPGPSLGTGLAALLSGANKYYALDVVACADNKRDLQILHELLELLENREKIPDESDFPKVKPHLESYEFPTRILTDQGLREALRQDRVESIRKALIHMGRGDEDGGQISYVVPWRNSSTREESVDFIFSQAVLEHVDDLAGTYEALYRWLKPGGLMSHQIDFKSHGVAREWNGHWAYSDLVWGLIRGKRPYLLNREPHSAHIRLLREVGFEVICDIKTKAVSRIPRTRLAPRFKNMSDDDFTTSEAFIQAIKVGQ